MYSARVKLQRILVSGLNTMNACLNLHSAELVLCCLDTLGLYRQLLFGARQLSQSITVLAQQMLG